MWFLFNGRKKLSIKIAQQVHTWQYNPGNVKYAAVIYLKQHKNSISFTHLFKEKVLGSECGSFQLVLTNGSDWGSSHSSASPPPSNRCMCAHSCPALRNPMDCSPPGCSVHGILQVRILEWVVHFLLQGIFPTQGSNPHLLHWQTDSLPWATWEALF